MAVGKIRGPPAVFDPGRARADAVRTRTAENQPQILSARREGLLRLDGEALRLAARTVHLGHNVFHAANLAFLV